MRRNFFFLFLSFCVFAFAQIPKDMLKRAQKGSVEDQYNLGVIYQFGKITDLNYEQALYWFKKAANQGHGGSYYSLGYLYQFGLGVEKDIDLAISYYKKSSEIGSPSGNAETAIGYCYCFELKDYKKAINWFEKAINKDNPIAMNNLGFCYYDGKGVTQDYRKAFSLFQKSAAKGDTNSYSMLAKMYYHGIGVLKNFQQAVFWSRKSAILGDGAAMNILGCCYRYGLGIKQDLEQAVFWFKKAMETDNAEGFSNLALCYAKGIGLEQDRDEALRLIDFAIEKQPNDVIYMDIKGEIFLALDETQNAMSVWEEMQGKYPGNQIAELQKKDNNVFTKKMTSEGYTLMASEVKQGKQQNNKKQELDNSIVISAQNNSKAVIESKIFNVDIDIPVNKTNNQNTYVVIIANENYQEVENVKWALNDGRIFKQYCERTLGIPEKNIRIRENATYNNIISAIDWLNSICEATNGNAKCIVYYSGHGIPDESTNNSFILPIDGSGKNIRTGYSLDELYETLGNMSAESVTLFLDACFSGANRGNNMLVAARGVAIKAKQNEPKGKLIVFSASQSDQTAYPYDEAKHGIFTYFLLRKLKETNGDCLLSELGDYITENVNKTSILENDKPQKPLISISSLMKEVWSSMKLK